MEEVIGVGVRGMELNKLRELPELYVAKASFSSYSGSLVSGSTSHYIITADSNPKFSLSMRENRALGLVKDAEVLASITIITERSNTPSITRGYTIYVSDKPFKVFCRHRGYTGDRCDDKDWVVEAQRTTFDQLLQMLP